MDYKKQNEVLLRVVESQINIIEKYSLEINEAEELINQLSNSVDDLVDMAEELEKDNLECSELIDTLTDALKSFGVTIDINEKDSKDAEDIIKHRMFGIVQ